LQPNSPLLKDKVSSKHARRIVCASGHTHLTSVKADATFTKEIIHGFDAIKMMMCIVSSFPFKEKVAFLVQCCLDNTADIPTGLPPIQNFKTVIIPAGCCNKAYPKVVEATPSPSTVRDCLLYLLRQDLLLDISGFQASQDFSKCYAISDFMEFIDTHVVHRDIEGDENFRSLSYDLTAVALAAGLPTPRMYNYRARNRWRKQHRPEEISRVIDVTRGIAEEAGLDCDSWAQRIVKNEFKEPLFKSF